MASSKKIRLNSTAGLSIQSGESMVLREFSFGVGVGDKGSSVTSMNSSPPDNKADVTPYQTTQPEQQQPQQSRRLSTTSMASRRLSLMPTISEK